MWYRLLAPANAVEASPDPRSGDVNLIGVRIAAWPVAGESLQGLDHFDLEIHDGLTIARGAMTVISDRPDQWTVEQPEERVFRIRPRPGAPPPVPGAHPWVFSLREVAIDEQVGTAVITATERRAGSRDTVTSMSLRIVAPELHIDHFSTIDATGAPISPHIAVEDGEIRLSWATTGADTVRLFGPEGEITEVVRSPGADPYHDARPASTSTYTLVADRTGGGHAVRQLTVTVADLVTKRLTRRAGPDGTGDPPIAVDGDLSMRAGTTVRTSTFSVAVNPGQLPTLRVPDGTTIVATADKWLGVWNGVPQTDELMMQPDSTLELNQLEVGDITGVVVVEGVLTVDEITGRRPTPPDSFEPAAVHVQPTSPLKITASERPWQGSAGVARLEIGPWAIITSDTELVIVPQQFGMSGSTFLYKAWWRYRFDGEAVIRDDPWVDDGLAKVRDLPSWVATTLSRDGRWD